MKVYVRLETWCDKTKVEAIAICQAQRRRNSFDSNMSADAHSSFVVTQAPQCRQPRVNNFISAAVDLAHGLRERDSAADGQGAKPIPIIPTRYVTSPSSHQRLLNNNYFSKSYFNSNVEIKFSHMHRVLKLLRIVSAHPLNNNDRKVEYIKLLI